MNMPEGPDIVPDAFPPDSAGGVTDAELKRLLQQARSTNDDGLRQLIGSYVSLRTLAAEMITLIAAREGGATVERTPLFRRLRQLSRREAG